MGFRKSLNNQFQKYSLSNTHKPTFAKEIRDILNSHLSCSFSEQDAFLWVATTKIKNDTNFVNQMIGELLIHNRKTELNQIMPTLIKAYPELLILETIKLAS